MISFDGLNKIITLASGITSVDAKDIYSDWKRWVQESDNSKWPIAFETVGGEDLSPGINAGSYYFIRNDSSWRIRPPEEDTTIYLIGNLTAKDSSLPILIPTTGNYRVLVAGLQPITQSVESLLLGQQHSSYIGQVNIDTLGFGVSGTSYPLGTASDPVNNVASAYSLATELRLDTFVIHGPIVLPSSSSLRHFKSKGGIATIDINGQDISATSFEGVQVYGTAPYAWTPITIRESNVYNFGNFQGSIANSIIDGSISFQAGLSEMFGCVGGASSTETVFNMRGLNTSLLIRNWTGPITFMSGTNPNSTIILDTLSSSIKIDSTCTSGSFIFYGVGNLTNNSTGNISLDYSLLRSVQVNAIENKINDLTALSL